MSKQYAGLGEFIRSRRAKIDPATTGLVSHRRRRVPGLRREELAELAGVSVPYLTKLEQGVATNASPEVLGALANALGLSEVERVHLLELAEPSGDRSVELAEDVRPGVRRLLVKMAGVPAVVLSRYQDVLDWNPLGHAMLAPHLAFDAPRQADTRPNQLRLIFTDPAGRAMYLDWAHEAELAVASLRFVAARFATDDRLLRLVGELCTTSDEFAACWARQPVQLCTGGTKRLHHPWVGALDADFEVLHLPEADGQRILTYTAAPDSPAEDAFALIERTLLTG